MAEKIQKMDDKKLLELNPFEYHWEDRYVSCVGEGNTSDDAILMGFKSAAELIISNIKAGQGVEDELIYPLLYSVRHCIELSIKISINLIKDLYAIKNVSFPIVDSDLHTHDIQELTGYLNQLYGFDRRFSQLFDLPLRYAQDYYFDKKSDVFRYERDLDGKESLKELNIQQISISIIEKKFLRMYSLFEYAIFSLIEYKREYCTGTFTKNLSRNDIYLISKDLMPYDKWGEKEFKGNLNVVKEKYNISSNELWKAIDIIKGYTEEKREKRNPNPLFASNIGLDILLGEIKDEELVSYAVLVDTFSDKSIFETTEITENDWDIDIDLLKHSTSKRLILSRTISEKALYSTAAFGDMLDTGDLYCENYMKHYNHFCNDEMINRDYLIRKISSYNFSIKVLNGMYRCGQKHYLSILNPLIAKIADSNNYTVRFLPDV